MKHTEAISHHYFLKLSAKFKKLLACADLHKLCEPLLLFQEEKLKDSFGRAFQTGKMQIKFSN